MTRHRLAVVGTDTDVGKTVVTAGLVRWFRENGFESKAIKPAQTGHPPDDDAAVVASACDDEDAAVCLQYLEPPLAPRVAAEVTDESLSYDTIRTSCERELAGVEIGVVEGIGGLRVPLTDEYEVIDLVKDLDCRAVLVARSGLGTLNHTALSVESLERRGVPVDAIVLNAYEGDTVAERTNPGELERLLDVPVVTVPQCDIEDLQELARTVQRSLSPLGDRLVSDTA